MPNEDTLRYRELVRLQKKDLALDVIGLEKKVKWAEEFMFRAKEVIDATFLDSADLARKESKPYNPVTDRLLKGIRMVKSVLEEMDWTETHEEEEGG